MGNLLWWAIGGGVVGGGVGFLLQHVGVLAGDLRERDRQLFLFENRDRARHRSALEQMQRDARSADTLAAEKAQSDAAAAAAADYSGMVM